MRKHGKIWGLTTALYRNPLSETHYLEIKKGGYCSRHKHARKINIFYVISGILEITQYDGTFADITELFAGQSSVIGLNVEHRFRALSDVQCIEIYEYRFSGEDIERFEPGGIDDEKERGKQSK